MALEPTPQLALEIEQLAAVSNTALVPLWARALEARSTHPILDDPAAIALVTTLRPLLAARGTKLDRQLVADRLPKLLLTTMALRTQYFDTRAHDFLLRFPRAVVVNLGAGLDTRFARLDAYPQPVGGTVRVVDVDLPPVTALKQRLFAPHPRHSLLAASVLEPGWMDALDRFDDRRFIFLAEGLLMYLPEAEVKRLVVTLAQRFPGAELVADLFHGRWLRPPWGKWVARKMQRQLSFSRDAAFQFGLDAPAAMAAWHPAIHFLDEWSMFDAPERKLGWWRWFCFVPLMRRIQYVVRYQFG